MRTVHQDRASEAGIGEECSPRSRHVATADLDGGPRRCIRDQNAEEMMMMRAEGGRGQREAERQKKARGERDTQ